MPAPLPPPGAWEGGRHVASRTRRSGRMETVLPFLGTRSPLKDKEIPELRVICPTAGAARILHSSLGEGEVERGKMSTRPANLYVGVALLGGLVGAALGLLVAPASGTETRRRVIGRSIEDQELLLRRAEMAAELLGDELDLPASA